MRKTTHRPFCVMVIGLFGSCGVLRSFAVRADRTVDLSFDFGALRGRESLGGWGGMACGASCAIGEGVHFRDEVGELVEDVVGGDAVQIAVEFIHVREHLVGDCLDGVLLDLCGWECLCCGRWV